MRPTPNQYAQTFVISTLATDIKDQLHAMENDPTFITKGSYSPASVSDVSFSDKHFTYISTHPAVKPYEYMANLRLKTRVR